MGKWGWGGWLEPGLVSRVAVYGENEKDRERRGIPWKGRREVKREGV